MSRHGGWGVVCDIGDNVGRVAMGGMLGRTGGDPLLKFGKGFTLGKGTKEKGK